jgi:hypothetical protein
MMGAMGNFDVLPDSVACLILSKLKNAQMVAQCAMVCHRWKMLSQLVDTLAFESFKLFEKKVDKNSKASCLEAIVTHMLLNTSGIRNLKISYHPVVWPWIPNDYFCEEKVRPSSRIRHMAILGIQGTLLLPQGNLMVSFQFLF